MILHEYAKRIMYENARVLSVTKWEINVFPEKECENDLYKVIFPLMKEFLE